jgi:VWFA-related protein
MVSLPVVVTTRSGKRVADLTKEEFQVFEDKVRQEIAGFSAVDEPFSVALMLDTSGSTMLQLEWIRTEAIRFINLLHPHDSVAVLSLAEEVALLEDFTVDRRRSTAAIRRTPPGGFTVLYEGVWLALEEVLKPVRERSALVLFTDGVDTASDKVTKSETRELAKESRSPIYSIYFNTQEDMQGSPRDRLPRTSMPPVIPGVGSSTEDYMGGRQYLTDLAENSGGMVFSAPKMEDLGPAFEAIARELTSQYSIGYYPTNRKRDGGYRKVEVKATRPGLYVQTRKGYWAADDSIRRRK